MAALVPKVTEAANFDLEEERMEGQTAAMPQLMAVLAAISATEMRREELENGYGGGEK